MGDHNACDFAQCVHETILRVAGAVRLGGLLCGARPLPRGPLWMGVYLDDLRSVEKVPRAGAPSVRLTEKFVPRAHSAYRESGFSRVPTKGSKGELQFRAWGAEVDGDRGLLAPPKEARQALAFGGGPPSS